MKNKADKLAHSEYLLKEAKKLIQIKEESMTVQINYCDTLRKINKKLLQDNYKLRNKKRELEKLLDENKD